MKSRSTLLEACRASFLAGLAVLALAANLSAQGIYATLTGVVSDPSQAVVTKAKVTLTNMQSGSQRETIANTAVFSRSLPISDGLQAFANARA